MVGRQCSISPYLWVIEFSFLFLLSSFLNFSKQIWSYNGKNSFIFMNNKWIVPAVSMMSKSLFQLICSVLLPPCAFWNPLQGSPKAEKYLGRWLFLWRSVFIMEEEGVRETHFKYIEDMCVNVREREERDIFPKVWRLLTRLHQY